MPGAMVENTINEDHLREELLQSAQSLPQNFPVIIKNFNEDNTSSSPKVRTFTTSNIDKYIELIQEFS